MREYWDNFKDFLFRCDTRYAEFLSGLLALGWGLTLLASGERRTSEQTNAMLAWAPLWWWGSQFVLLSGVQIVGALFGLETFRRWAGLFICPFWLFIFAVFMTTSQLTGILAYGGFALTCSWVYLRLANRSPIILRLRRFLYGDGGGNDLE